MDKILEIVTAIKNRLEDLGQLIIDVTSKGKSGTFAIFKGTGAAKFSIIPLRRNERGFVDKDGAVLLEAAPVIGKRPDGLPDCDWSNKITFALGVPDICNILEPGETKLFHQNKNSGETKKLQLVKGRQEGTYMMYLDTKGGSSDRKVTVPFKQGEFMVLQRLLIGAVPDMLGW